MSRSKKKFPAGVWCGCKSQKKGKRVVSKRFRRYTKILIAQAKYDLLPKRSIEKLLPGIWVGMVKDSMVIIRNVNGMPGLCAND